MMSMDTGNLLGISASSIKDYYQYIVSLSPLFILTPMVIVFSTYLAFKLYPLQALERKKSWQTKSYGLLSGILVATITTFLYDVIGILAFVLPLAVCCLGLNRLNYYQKTLKIVQIEKECLNSTLNYLATGILACDSQGNISLLNHSLHKYVSTLDKTSRHIDDLFKHATAYTKDDKPISKEHSPLKYILQGQRIRGLELKLKFINGVSREVIIDGQQLFNSSGKVLGALAVLHDVTELRKADSLKNEFISTVSHELRTPLTSIRGALGLLASGVMGTLSAQSIKFLHLAKNNSDRLLSLITNILDMEKIKAGKMEFEFSQIELNSFVRDVITLNQEMIKSSGVKIECLQTQEPISLITDPGRLTQVLTQLISNACKFSPEQETIKITLEAHQALVRVSIEDKGPGIPLEFQERIFQKFTQADSSDNRGKGGTGIGLTFSKCIIEKLGGKLDFYSKPREGAIFYFELPLALDLSAEKLHLRQKEGVS